MFLICLFNWSTVAFKRNYIWCNDITAVLNSKSTSNNIELLTWYQTYIAMLNHGFLTRYAKLRVAHAPGMPGTFSLPPTSKENASQRSRHASRHVRDARAVMHVGIAIPRWRGKRSRNFRRMRKTQFYVCGKRPMYNLVDNATNGHNTGS